MSDTIKMDDLNSQAVGLAKKLRKLPKNTNISFRRFAMMHSNAHTQEKRTRKRATMSDQPIKEDNMKTTTPQTTFIEKAMKDTEIVVLARALEIMEQHPTLAKSIIKARYEELRGGDNE